MHARAADPLSQVHLYIHSFAGGGAERVFVRLANHFAAQGIGTRLVVNSASGPLRSLLSDDVHLVDLGAPRAHRAIPRLAGYLRRQQPEVLMSAMTRVNIGALLARRLSAAQTRIVVSERNQPTSLMRHWPARQRWTSTFLLQRLYPGAEGIAAVTDGVADDLVQMTGIARERITVVHNPAPDESEVRAARDAPPPHAWFEEETPVIVAVGRLVPQKGYATLLEALALARARRPIRLIALGEGPQRAELAALADSLGLADAILFPGFVLNRLDYLAKAALYVLASDTEGFPNALVEALACDTKVVSTDCAGGGARTILANGGEHAITPVGNAPRLADAILEALERSVPPGEMAQFSKRYSIAETADKFLAIMGARP